MNKGIIVGIDIGSTKICAVAGIANDNGEVTILAMVEEPTKNGRVTKGSVVNLDLTANDIDNILNRLSDSANINIENVIVNISGENVEGKSHQNFLTRNDSRTTITEVEIIQLAIDIRKSYSPTVGNIIIHTFPQEFVVDRDAVPENPIGRFGIKLGGNFFLISTPSGPYTALQSTISRVGAKVQDNRKKTPLKVVKTLFSPIADSLAVLSENDKKTGVAVVNIGGETTEVAIFHEYGLRHISVIPFAGKSITNDLVKAFQILPTDAENLKIIIGAVPTHELSDFDIIKINGVDGLPDKDVVAKDVSIIIEERLKEIAAMVMAEIIHSGYEGQLISGIILTGGTANIQMIQEVFYHVSNKMNIRVGRTLRNIKNTEIANIKNPKYSTVVGLLLSGFVKLDERVSDDVIFGDTYKSDPIPPIPTDPGSGPVGGIGLWGWLKQQMNSGKDLGDAEGYIER